MNRVLLWTVKPAAQEEAAAPSARCARRDFAGLGVALLGRNCRPSLGKVAALAQRHLAIDQRVGVRGYTFAPTYAAPPCTGRRSCDPSFKSHKVEGGSMVSCSPVSYSVMQWTFDVTIKHNHDYCVMVEQGC